MKKILIFMATAVIAFCCQSCKFVEIIKRVIHEDQASQVEQVENVESVEQKEDVEQVGDSSANPYASFPIIYANSYDGFVNIRAIPDSKGEILGRFNNGPKGAYLLEAGNVWYKISCNGIVGYVYSPYLSNVPTPAVNVDISSGWLYGEWVDAGSGLCNIIIKSNGKYVYGNYIGVGYVFKGTWRLEGNDIVFTTTHWPEPDIDLCGIDRVTLDGNGRTIKGWKRGHIDPASMGA